MNNLAKYIDHTLLKPTATSKDIVKLCEEAIEYNFYSVCINSCWLKLVRHHLPKSDIKICTVVGFPLGSCSPAIKCGETDYSVSNGSDEIDMVMNIGFALENKWDIIEQEIEGVVLFAFKQPVKVILETCYLNNEQIATACKCVVNSGAKFVKTSTGFGSAGATIEHVKLMRETVGIDFGVKASGGIKDRATAEAMIAAGANRLGTSSGVIICENNFNKL